MITINKRFKIEFFLLEKYVDILGGII